VNKRINRNLLHHQRNVQCKYTDCIVAIARQVLIRFANINFEQVQNNNHLGLLSHLASLAFSLQVCLMGSKLNASKG